MNFYEEELRKIISPRYPDAVYIGQVCYVTLGKSTRAKIHFSTSGQADHYNALQMTILGCEDGKVDSLFVRFSDLFGKKMVSNPNFPNGIVPHIWQDGLNIDWHVYHPTAQDYKLLGSTISDYLGVFQPPEMKQEQGHTGAKAPQLQQTFSM